MEQENEQVPFLKFRWSEEEQEFISKMGEKVRVVIESFALCMFDAVCKAVEATEKAVNDITQSSSLTAEQILNLIQEIQPVEEEEEKPLIVYRKKKHSPKRIHKFEWARHQAPRVLQKPVYLARSDL